MGNSGIATPFWYEWEVGLCKCLEMLYNENIESVVFQAAEFQSIDDVVVNYRDSSSLNIQVKHTDISANFTYSFLESDDLLKTWAQDWIKTRAKYNIRKIQIVTNKRWGSNKNRCEQKCSFEHFVTVVFPELQKDYEYNVASIFDANAIAWYKKQLDGIEYEDAAVFTKLLSFQQAPELCELEDAIHLELKKILGTDREDAINASQCSLFAHLAKWTTSQRKDEKVFPEDVYEALCVTENIPQKELYPEKPIFPSRIDFAQKFVDSVKNSNKRLIVLEGLPGAGKTNFVSYLDQSKDSIVDFRFYTYLPHSSNMHYFSDDAGFYSSELLWSSILVQLRNKFSEMKLLHALSFPLRYGLMTVQEKRATALKYLSLFAKYSRKTCYIFIDGLDHAARCSDYLPSFIPQLPMPDEIPDGVKFVLVGQPINDLYPTWMSRKNDQIEFYVMPLLEPQDVKMLISYHSISIPNIDISALADSIIKVVGNNTLNILFAIQEVSQLPKSETFDDIIVKLTEKQLSGHISNYYEWIFNSINIASDNKIAIEKMLMIFAFATQEISAEQISQLIDLDIFETTHYLNTLFPLIRSNNGLFYALHNDVRLYLKQKMLANSDFSALAMCFNKRIEANSDLEILKYSLLFSVLEESSDTQWIVQLFNCEYILNSIKYKIPIPTLLQQFQSVVRAIRDSKNMEYISALSLSSTMLSQYINCAEYYEKNFLLHSDLKYGKKTEAEKYIFDPQIEREAIVRDIYNLLSHDQVDRGKSLYNEYFGTFTITDFLQHCSEHETAECEGNTIQQETSKYIEQIGYICRYCNPVILCSHNSITENECLMFSTGWLEASKAFINEDEIRISLSVKCFYQYDLYLYIRELIGMSCIRAEHFSVLNDFFLQMKEVPLISMIDLCAAEILSGNTNDEVCIILLDKREQIVSDCTFDIHTYKIEHFFRLLFCLYQYKLSEEEINTLYIALLKECNIKNTDRGYAPANKLLSVAKNVFAAFYSEKFNREAMKEAILSLAYIANSYGPGSISDCEAHSVRKFIYNVILSVYKNEKNLQKKREVTSIITLLFTSDVPHYFRELSPIYFLTNSRAEFRTVTDFWAGPSGVIWSESYSEIEYVCEDICAILDKLGEGNLSNDVRKRMNFKLLGYSGHKDYSMNDLLAWYISLPLSKDKLLTYGMQLLKVSDMAHSTGDNRLAGSVDSEIFDVSMLLGPKYLDALFELKNTVETFYNWRECILDTLYKKLPDASIADDDIMCIHKIVNAWINPQYEQRRQYSNKIEYLCEFNYKIAESISDTALKDEVLASDNCAHTDKTPEYHIPEEDSLDTYGQILELIQNNEYSFDVEKKICEVLLEDTSKSTSKRIRFLETAGSFIKEEYKASFVSKCVVPFITTNNEYGLRMSGLISLIEKYYHLVSQDDWLKLFCSCMPKEFSVNERSFYYTNDDIEAINLYYNKGYHPDKIEILFSQRIEMHLHWITAGGLIDCPQYSLCIDESISSLNDFVQKHLGV